MRGDGDGWSHGPAGIRYWGRFGAAGLLLRAPLADGGAAVLMQHRASWSHHGDTWALPGGARDSQETAVDTALREAAEEAGVAAGQIVLRAQRVTATTPQGWTYTTVIADAGEPFRLRADRESRELAWIPESEVTARPLHPGFARTWPVLRATAIRLDPAVQLADPDLATTLPRTLDLSDRGFWWLHAIPDGPGSSVELVQEPDLDLVAEVRVSQLTRAQILAAPSTKD